MLNQPVQCTQNHLLCLKRIVVFNPFIVILDFQTTLFIKQGKLEIESTYKFNKPLKQQRTRDQDEYSLGFTRYQKLVQDQSCFNGLTKTNFISEQYSRLMPISMVRPMEKPRM